MVLRRPVVRETVKGKVFRVLGDSVCGGEEMYGFLSLSLSFGGDSTPVSCSGCSANSAGEATSLQGDEELRDGVGSTTIVGRSCE